MERKSKATLEDALLTGLIIAIAIFLTACGSAPKQRGFELPPALSETMRGGTLKGLETADSPDLGMPNQYDRVSHVCISEPIYNLAGQYVRTTVKCW